MVKWTTLVAKRGEDQLVVIEERPAFQAGDGLGAHRLEEVVQVVIETIEEV